ncbi:hypothetical protein PsorP6_004692 [Peronosclerospora sorghi]|uniref:Uncharacterized protein n=1 Tax=Peronosclerospora sorghi TaxID=230839 RepID=A0ACC0VKK8_9STRA|nr:hypothetical protein PsorP6_004692 [Peronosclerospora sorghi]
MMQSLHQEVNEIHEQHESVLIKVKGREQDVTVWQEKYKEKKKQIHEMENALMNGRQQVEKQDENLELVKAENRKLQEHMDMMAQEHQQHIADHYKSQREAEQRVRQALEQESTRSQAIKEEAEEMRGQIESQAMSATNQREQQLLDVKARLEDDLQHQISKLDEENAELRAKVEGLKDFNRRKSIQIGRLMVVSQETGRQKEIHSVDTQRMQQLQEEVNRVKHQNKKLLQDMATKDSTYEETIKSQSGQFQTQYNELVSQVTNQINDLTREDEQLRAELDDAAKKWKCTRENYHYKAWSMMSGVSSAKNSNARCTTSLVVTKL